MEQKLIDNISEFFLNNFSWNIYKNFIEGDEITKEYFLKHMEHPLALIGKKGIEKDMLNIQIKEAQDEGYIEGYETENVDLNSMNAMVFDITDKGKEYIIPYIKDKLKSHYQELINTIEKI